MAQPTLSRKQAEKAEKREHLTRIRKALGGAIKLAERTDTPVRRLIVRHDQIRFGIVGLWTMGFWTDHIAECIGEPFDEELVMGVLRRHYRQVQDQLVSLQLIKPENTNER